MTTRLIVVSGLSCSGKSTLMRALREALDAATLALDDYYFETDPAQREATNFDDPATLDWALLRSHVRELVAGRPIRTPIYGFNECRRLGEREVQILPFTVLEGQYCALDEEIVSLADLTVMLDVDSETCLARRIERDQTLGRSMGESVSRFGAQILPEYRLVEPVIRARSRLVLPPAEVESWVAAIRENLS